MSASIPPAGIARERTVLWGVFITLKHTEIVRNMIFKIKFRPIIMFDVYGSADL